MMQRVLCPGSYALSKTYKIDDDTEASAAGTATHWVAETCLGSNGNLFPIDFTDDKAPNGVVLTETLLEAPTEYVNHIYNVLRELGAKSSELMIEIRVDLSWVDGEMFGTCDLALHHAPSRTLYVWDYKNGYDAVEADTIQNKFYALGIAKGLDIDRVICGIVQPNAGGVKSVTYSIDEVNTWPEMFREIVAKCRAIDALRVAGVKQCKWCPVSAICPENRAHAWSLYESVPKIPADIGDEMDALDSAIEMMKQRKKSLDKTAYDMVFRRGISIPRHKLVQPVRQRKWHNDEHVIQICELLDVDPYAERKLKSPSKLSKDVDKAVLNELCFKPDANPTLVKITTRGTAVANNLQNRFANVQGGILKGN